MVLFASVAAATTAASSPPGLKTRPPSGGAPQTPPFTLQQTPPPSPLTPVPLDPALAKDPGPIFRVFMTDGRALASYGECALLDDRVVFTLVIGDGGLHTEYQLMSLPASAVDLERTTRYRDGVRAFRYAATRGETDYAAMTAEVSRSLDEVAKITDPARRLEAAEAAKKRLLAWSEENYHYRAKDIQDLAALFDDVIAQLRVAAGGDKLSLELVAGQAPRREEPIRPAPTLRESIELALAAASAADVTTDRAAILRAAAAVSAGAAGVDDLASEVTHRIEEEQAVHRAYAALLADALDRARPAIARGDVAAVDAVRRDAVARELGLAARRPDEMEAVLREIDAARERTRARRLELDHYAMMRPRLLAYERDVRPVLSAFDGAASMLKAIHEMSDSSVTWLARVEGRLSRLEPQLAALGPPEDLTDVHATLLSALHLAVEACKRRRLSLVANSRAIAREASASAAGAEMLAESARANLVARLYPPKVR